MPFVSGRPLSPGTKRLGFAANSNLQSKINTLAEQRHKSRSEIIRMLLWLGLESYEINRLEGNSTTKRRQMQATKRKAMAEANAASRERQRAGYKNTTPAVTPVLWGEADDN